MEPGLAWPGPRLKVLPLQASDQGPKGCRPPLPYPGSCGTSQCLREGDTQGGEGCGGRGKAHGGVCGGDVTLAWVPRLPPVPVTTVRIFLLCPRNSHSSPFFKMPWSRRSVTTVPGLGGNRTGHQGHRMKRQRGEGNAVSQVSQG